MMMNANTSHKVVVGRNPPGHNDPDVTYAFDIDHLIPLITLLFDVAKTVMAQPEVFNGTTQLMAMTVTDIEQALDPQLEEEIRKHE